jgi:glycosyltransferase involved in cell wall biosynthesis
MRFAFVSINGMPWGGSEVLWAATAKRCLQENNSVLISIYDWPQLPQPIKELKKIGAEFYFRRRFYPNIYQRVKKIIFNLFLSTGKKKTYHDYLLRFNPDHILFSLGEGGEIARDNRDLMLFIRQTDIPYSIFCHEIWLVGDEEKNYLNNLIACFKKAKYVFFTSKMILENTQQALGKLFDNFQIMNHPLQNNEAEILSFPPKSPAKFAMIGSLVLGRKGHDIALKALAHENWKKRDWELNIYGNGGDEVEIKKMISQCDFENHVKMHGHVKYYSDVWRNNHIVLFPSRTDSGPITLFETMLAGRAVVGTKMGAIPEYIIDGKNGIIASKISVDAFEVALEKAWAHRNEWQKWGVNARETLIRKYNFSADKLLLKKMKQL